MKDTLKQVIFDQQTSQQTNLIKRSIPESLINCQEIMVISGIRRCGKSTLLQQIRALQDKRDYYINFDDERLVDFKIEHCQLLHEVFIELFGEQKVFYFDEIQNITGWERFVRRLYDSGYKVFITGSNASMLSKELGTHLTGRYCQYELYPFSFIEYLSFKKIEVSDKDFYSTQGKAKLLKEFQIYQTEGGFPQYLQNKQGDYLKSLYESILYRDVMVRNHLTNEHELLTLVHYLASNVSSLSSYNSLTKIIGVKNAATIKSYIDFMQNSYLLFQINKYDYAIRKQIQNPKKTYFIDNALVKRLGFNFAANTGHLLENIVFLELKRRGKELFYHHGKFECDFVVQQNSKITEAFQVCHNIDNDVTRKREMSGLINAMDSYGLKQGVIITTDTNEEIFVDDKTIKVIAVWKWLLSK